MVWLGDFNRHHLLWDKARNSHLFTPAALEAAGKLLKLVADHGMTQILPKDIPMLQSSSTGNWTRPDNIFCTEHTRKLLLPASAELPAWNYRSVDWDKFNSLLTDSLTELSGHP